LKETNSKRCEELYIRPFFVESKFMMKISKTLNDAIIFINLDDRTNGGYTSNHRHSISKAVRLYERIIAWI